MELRVEREALADAVTWTARSLPARPPMQVLLGLLLDATGPDALQVSGFDYEVSSQVGLDSTAGLLGVAEPGRALVPGRLLADIVRALPQQPVELRLDGSRVVLTCGTARFTLPTLPVEDYPALPALPETAGTIDSTTFAAAVAQVAVAAGRDDSLPVLTGVRVEIDDDLLTLAATDRYRLAVRTLAWRPAVPGLMTTALLPARTMADTAKALAGGSDVTVALSTGTGVDGLIGFEGGDKSGTRRTTSRLLDGEFPKYRSLLPDSAAGTAQVATTPFGDAVRRVALVAPRNAPVRVTFFGDAVVLEAGGQDEASASEQLAASWAGQLAEDGAPFSIAFNPAYLLDGLSAVDSATTVLSFTGPTKPAVLTGGAPLAGGDPASDGVPASRDYRYLLMPVRLSG